MTEWIVLGLVSIPFYVALFFWIERNTPSARAARLESSAEASRQRLNIQATALDTHPPREPAGRTSEPEGRGRSDVVVSPAGPHAAPSPADSEAFAQLLGRVRQVADAALVAELEACQVEADLRAHRGTSPSGSGAPDVRALSEHRGRLEIRIQRLRHEAAALREQQASLTLELAELEAARDRAVASPSRRGLRCPWCHDQLDAVDQVACPSCSTPHHADCREEAGGCVHCTPRARRVRA